MRFDGKSWREREGNIIKLNNHYNSLSVNLRDKKVFIQHLLCRILILQMSSLATHKCFSGFDLCKNEILN